jgi:hypothetical protein
MPIPIISTLVATVLQFICGFVWYGPLFSNLWGKIHGFDKLPKAVQQKMMKQMGPFYATQFLVTVVTTIVLSVFTQVLPSWSVFETAALLWIGFIVPTQVSGVIFGGTDPKWIMTKIGIMSGGAFVCVEVAAAVLYFI